VWNKTEPIKRGEAESLDDETTSFD
jgi:hypothetical protein